MVKGLKEGVAVDAHLCACNAEDRLSAGFETDGTFSKGRENVLF